MINKTIGFIGGGRVTRVILGGFQRAGQAPGQVIVSDANAEVLNKLKEAFPEVVIALNDNCRPAAQDIVFVALHPPAIGSLLGEIKSALKPNSVLVSLAPKVTMAKLAEGLGGFSKIARMIPNAPSIVAAGYNPLAFSTGLTAAEKEDLKAVFGVLGECPEVSEDTLEAYAILTAMGPTYLWFQLYELGDIARSFGLTPQEVETGLSAMTVGAIRTMRESGLSPEQVMDLIPVKPLAEEEGIIKNAYHARLEALYKKLKG